VVIVNKRVSRTEEIISTRENVKTLGNPCPSIAFSTMNPSRTCLGSKSGFRTKKSATNRLSHGNFSQSKITRNCVKVITKTHSPDYFILFYFILFYFILFYFIFSGTAAQRWLWPPRFSRFLDHTKRRVTVGSTPLDE
jgi:hypothetical protein